MKRLTFALMLTLILAPTLTRAQETAPWPPDPKDIFAEGVEIVSMEIIEPQPIPENPYPVADDTARVVRVYDLESAQWREFPYPEEAKSLSQSGIHARSDGTLVINEPYSESLEGQPEIWILNPTTGEFSRAEIVCGWKVKALPHEGEWLFYWDEQGARLCFTETGELSAPLAKDAGWSNQRYSGSPKMSPDGKWLFLMGFVTHTDGTIDHYDFYGYEIATGRLNYLGSIPHDMLASYAPGFGRWVSNTQGLVDYGPPQESLSKAAYAFDVSQPNSIQLIVRGWVYNFYDNPPRYEYPTTKAFLEWKTGSSYPDDTPCRFIMYDGNGVHTYELGANCIYADVRHIGDGKYLYIETEDWQTETSALTLLNTNTGNITNLVEGEIEWLQGVSPDGRYALLVMDGNGKIDLADYYFDYVDWRQLPTAYLAVFDMVNLRLVYASTPFSYQGRFLGGWTSFWCGDNCLIISVFGTNPYTSLVVLGESGANETRVNGVGWSYTEDYSWYFRLSPNKERLLIRDTTNLIDFKNQTLIPILVQGTQALYDFDLSWIDNTRIKVKVYPKGSSWKSNQPVVIYTIKVT